MSIKDLSSILNGFSDCAFLIGPDRRVLAANDAARVVFAELAEGEDFVRLMRRPEALSMIDDALRGKARAQSVLTLDGALRGTFRVTAAPVDGVGAVVSFADLSHIFEAEQMRSDFAANVSHELRSPLTALVGFIETLKGPARGDSAAEERFLDLMEREAGRMTRLIRDLLSLSRVEVDGRVRPTDRVDIADIVRQVMASLARFAESEGMEVRLTAPEAPVEALGDEDQLIQVFQNLIENAIRYGGAGGAVGIDIRQVESAPGLPRPAVRVEVRDWGHGIGREHLPRLTERFYRVDAGRSRDKGGTGLGLAIVKHIVQRHRGRLLIDSEPGAGSRFTVLLPSSD